MVAEANRKIFNGRLVVRADTLVLGYIFLCLPFFDMFTGFLVVRGFIPEGSLGSPSQLGRLLAIVVLLFVARNIKVSPIFISFFIILFLIESVSALYTNSTTAFFFGFVTVIRFFYMYLLFLVLATYAKDNPPILGKYLRLNLNFICASILFAFATDLGNSTYGWGFGTKGFFASGNGLGIYVGVSALVLVAFRRQRIYTGTGNVSLGLALASLLLLGTKTGLLLAVTLLLVMLWTSRYRFLIIPLAALALAILFPRIIDLSRFAFDVMLSRYERAESLQAFLLSSRDGYISDAFRTLLAQDIGIFRWWFGGGAYLSFQNPMSNFHYDTLETDLFDLLFMYGIFGLAAYLVLLAVGIKLNIGMPYMLLGFMMLSLHSVIAGHVLFNGMSSTLLIVIIAASAAIQSQQRADRRHSLHDRILSPSQR